MPQSLCPNDVSFGPSSDCRNLDFTVTFQAIILSLLPDSIFIIYALIRISVLYSYTSKLSRPGWALLLPKIILTLLAISLNATIVAFSLLIRKKQGFFIVGISSAIVSLLASIILFFLVIQEHFKALSPSTLVISYSGLIKGLFGTTALRTGIQTGLWKTHRGLFIVSAITTGLYFAVGIVELVEKRLYLTKKYQNYPIQSTSSFVTRALFVGFLPMLWSGRTTKLSYEDLRDIPEDQKARSACERLGAALKITKPGGAFLSRATLKAFGAPLLLPVLPRTLLMLATVAQPLLVNSMVAFIDSADPVSRGWALVGGYICIYGVMPIATALYWQKVYAVTVQYRAALVGCIYQKSLKLAFHEGNFVGTGAASTYMSVDVERVCQGLEWIHELWASFISIIFAIAILYSQATWPAFLPIAVLILILGLTSMVGGNVSETQSNWLKATDKRIKLISSIIKHFMPMKWAGYEPHMERDISHLREVEVNLGKAFCNLAIVLSSLSTVALPLCMTVTLATYAVLFAHGKVQGPLDATRMFSIASTIFLLSGPVNFLGQQLPMVLAAYASLERIQGFLQLEEKPQDVANTKQSLPQVTLSFKGSYSWTTDSEPVLRNIDVHLPANKLTVCVGPVASGKTSLLMSILGETVPSNRIKIHGGISYASQEAFIFPGTIRENIVCDKPFNGALYANVLESCALDSDLSRQPNGDQTILGDQGLTLSGGQRQRIGLARAVYAQTALTLLDDVFSALDAETEAHVFESLFGPGGLLYDRTVLLITHNASYVNSASWVLVLEGGVISHQGTPDEIRGSGYDLSTHIISFVSPKASTPSRGKEVAVTNTPEKELSAETTDFGSQGFVPYWFYFRAGGWHRVIIAMTFLFLWRALVLASQGYLKEWSESGGRHFQAWVGGYVSFAVLGFIFSLISMGYYLRGLAITSSQVLHRAELNAVLASPSTIITEITPGRLINRFSQDINTLDYAFPLALLNTLLVAIGVVGTVILLVIPAPFLALLVPPLVAIYTLVLRFYLGTSKQLQGLEAASKSPLYKVFGTTLAGLETIRAFNLERYFQKQNDVYLDQSQGPYYFRFMGQAFLGTALSFITLIVSVALSALAVGLRQKTNPALLGVALSNLANLTNLLSMLLNNWAAVENGTVALQRIQETVELPAEEVTFNQSKRASFAGRLSIAKEGAWPIHGSVVFQDFGMKYRKDLPPVLRNINVAIQGGTKLGICGRTGSGKSSMVMALLRSCPHTTGRILIDGVDISRLELRALRSSLSVISQDPFLWHAPLRDNLDPARICNDEMLWAALQRVGMNEAVIALPEKLETVLEESSLSRGQKQLLCMARVLLRQRQIVILDEATSSMDIETDKKIREIISTDLSDRTVIAVAHRIATISKFDLVIVMENGLIVESGDPQALLLDSESHFHRLAATQGLLKNGERA